MLKCITHKNFYSNNDLISTLLTRLNLRFMIFNYLNQIHKLSNSIHPNQDNLLSKTLDYSNSSYSDFIVVIVILLI